MPFPIKPFFTEELIYDTVRPLDQRRSELLEAARNFLDHHEASIFQQHRQGASGTEIVYARARLHDSLIRVLHDAVKAGLDDYIASSCALIAVGGYGRGELNPTSDIDLMFYHNGRKKEEAEQVSQPILYFLWDLGLDVGYSVRTARDCIEIASSDITARTAMLDSRFLVGDHSLYTDYERNVFNVILAQDSRSFIKRKLDENARRLEKYGSTVYMLEPNIKEGEGGLRDLHTAIWIARVKYKAKTMRELLIRGVINEGEYNDFLSAFDYLWQVRNELHYLSGRKNEQLHFDQQEEIAKFLGYRDSSSIPAVEQFMQDFYSHATRVEHLSSLLIAKVTARDESTRRVLGYFTRRPVDEGFFVLHGELGVTSHSVITDNPAAMMRAFELSQKHNADLSLALKTLIRENLYRINNRVRRSGPMLRSFFNILRFQKGLGGILREMHHLRFLGRFIPEFDQIYCKVQHDAYHVYTVDTHSIFAVEEIVKLWEGHYRQRKPVYTRVAGDIEKKELLLLAVLLHDIGKGEGKDHASKGAAMIPRIARRLRLNRENSQRLQFLVQQHLEMAHLSQRRDLNDDKLILQFARKMGMSENLKMLFLLTFADIKAVGPNVWSEWKGRLLQELYEKAYHVIEKGNFYLEKRSEKVRNRKRRLVEILRDEFDPRLIRESYRKFSTRYLLLFPAEEIADHLRLTLSRGKKSVNMKVEHDMEAGFTNLTISTLDIPGLFSKICGVMAGNGLSILSAKIYTRSDGEVIDILDVCHSVPDVQTGEHKWREVEEDLMAVLEGRVPVAELVKRQQKPSFLTERARPCIPNRVEVDNEVSDEYTVIDVYTADRVGILYYITKTIRDLGFFIIIAKISTKVDQVSDTFYLQDIFGQKIVDTEKMEELEAGILSALEEIEEDEAMGG